MRRRKKQRERDMDSFLPVKKILRLDLELYYMIIKTKDHPRPPPSPIPEIFWPIHMFTCNTASKSKYSEIWTMFRIWMLWLCLMHAHIQWHTKNLIFSVLWIVHIICVFIVSGSFRGNASSLRSILVIVFIGYGNDAFRTIYI